MSEEKGDFNTFKVEVPLFKEGEIEQFNKYLNEDYDNIIDKITKQVIKDKELAYWQMIVKKQQKEIEALKIIHETYKEIVDKGDFISKDKMRWRPISEYDRKKYDWVLVKYYDGEFECVPIVAEQRNRKWFSRNDIEIPFEVKYFFDMQELLEGE